MTQIDKEKFINKYPLPVTIDETELILKQMKNSICKIENKNGKGTGFFCKISNKKLLITNEHVINEEIIKDNNIIKVKLNDNKIRKDIKILDYYISKEYDTTIIEIKDIDENINYLELDNEIFDENVNINNESIYIIQYPKFGNEQKGAVSYGILNEIQSKYNIIHYCSTEHGSSGSPILKLSSKKIIGIHKEGVSKYNFNRGTLLKYPINEYLNRINEVNLKVKIEKEDINKDIYFLDNTEHHDNLKELNELNTEIFINNIKYKYKKSFKPEKEGLYEIKIKFNIKNCSYMFYNCSNLTKIDLSYFDTKNVIDMSCMFYGCSNLTSLDLSSFNTQNVNNMSDMFYECSNLTNIDLSSFDTKNVINMSSMFKECSKLTNINLSSFNTKNVTNMSYIFSNCSNLSNVNLSSFDTENVTNMSYMFNACWKLINIDLSSFDTNKVTNMNNMFSDCWELTNINLSSFDTQNVTDMGDMFYDCFNLTNIDLSSFNTNNVKNMTFAFDGCSKLNLIKINKNIFNKINELSLYKNIKIIDQFGKNINNSTNNNNPNNSFNNNYMYNFNNNMINNNFNMMKNMNDNNFNMNNNMIKNYYNINNSMNNNNMNNIMTNNHFIMNNNMNNSMINNNFNNNIMNNNNYMNNNMAINMINNNNFN